MGRRRRRSRVAAAPGGAQQPGADGRPARGAGAARSSDRNGKPLLAIGTVYDVQIDPARATPATVASPREGRRRAGRVTDRQAGGGEEGRPRAPIPVITYREADFADRARRAGAAGRASSTPRREQPLAPTRTFGQPLLGSYGPVTAEMVSKGKGRYVAGDHAGLSGIQGQYDALLGGTAGVTVTVEHRPGHDAVRAARGGRQGRSRWHSTRAVQAAAEKALAGSRDVPSALVAVDVKTGDVLAVGQLTGARASTGRWSASTRPGRRSRSRRRTRCWARGAADHAVAVPAERSRSTA